MSYIRCLTLNLKGLGAGWFDGRSAVVVDGLRKAAPDVICFQEVTVRYGTKLYDQAQYVGRQLGLPFCSFSPYGNPIEVMSSDQGGIAIVSRWPMLSVRNRRLPPAHDHPPDARVALLSVIATPLGPVSVVNTHLSWRPEEAPIRLVQAGLILDDLLRCESREDHGRVVFAGDLNAIETEPAIQLAQEHLVDSFRFCHPEDPGFTVLRSNPLASGWDLPDRRLDYVFCSEPIEIRRAEVILSHHETRLPASDHAGVMADLTWKAA